jgi:hypothetical protein
MKHVKQNWCECSLAVCAMVSGEDYETVGDYARTKFENRPSAGYQQWMVADIWETFGLGEYIALDRYFSAPMKDLGKLKLKGRGHLLYRHHTMSIWHHVAYQSGMVYDGRCERPLSVKAWTASRSFAEHYSTKCRVVVEPVTAANKGVK